ncbi:MAG TPA: thioredoxin domain-containing protein [Polyangia bacterium]|nr:thioredoxin domain-containing protein [Polyangia bacterium]
MQLKSAMTARDHARGPATARVTLTTYGDYECRASREADRIVRRLEMDLGDDLRVVFRHFPLAEEHRHARAAAEIAEAASLQGRFWDMHDALFEQQDRVLNGDLLAIAHDLGLDMAQLLSDAGSQEIAQRVDFDLQRGTASGVDETPAVFLNGVRYLGAWSYDSMMGAIRGGDA